MKEVENFLEQLRNIKYGWHDRSGNVHKTLSEGNFKKDYLRQKTKDIVNSGYAICWELCELERNFFKKKRIKHQVIMALYNDQRKYPCHTFLLFELDGKLYHFEASWEGHKGIHEFDSLEEVIDYFREHFSDFAKRGYDKSCLEFYSYQKPFFRSCNYFYFHAMHGKRIG